MTDILKDTPADRKKLANVIDSYNLLGGGKVFRDASDMAIALLAAWDEIARLERELENAAMEARYGEDL